MPSIIPGYVYTLFAALVVGAILVSSCSLLMLNLKNEADTRQLANVDEYVAARSLNLLAHTSTDQQNTTQFLNLPPQIGNQQYWICLTNDSSQAWVESGFGATVGPAQAQAAIPVGIEASGIFVSSWGRAFLSCSQNQTAILELDGSG